ncbi:hypothetical protein [Brevundimonas sp.]|uniref:hypothetical protein n=1 Tax=Brevundimonas sp. TaxID=1871086 RepID=UPI001A26BC62|nr:hypothetical protein [Brevundimonas sp.]MBJ7483513.1 hypothetical protein [Brevundimonas sp.]
MIKGEAITFGVYEANHRTSERLTRKDEGYRKDIVQWRQVWSPSGRLILVIRVRDWGGERRWSERPGKLLESQVDRFTLRLERLVEEKAANEARCDAYQREVEIAQRHTARRVFKEQERRRRPAVVRALAAQWEEAARLRAFLDTLESRNSPLPSAMSQWLGAARDDLQALDPLSPAGLSALQFHVDAVAPGPEDDAPRHPDEHYWFDEGAMNELADEMFAHVRLPTKAKMGSR